MDKLHQNINPELIAAFLSNQISSEEAAAVQNWIDASQENRNHFEQFKTVFEETGKLIPAPVDVDVDMAWNEMSCRIDVYEQKNKPVSNAHNHIFILRKTMLRVAAVLIPLITISIVYLLLTQKQKTMTKLATNQIVHDTLSDGSVVSLNNNSKLTYPEKFNGNMREVSMEGEAFFDIKPDKEKPFVIHTENMLIKVLGTSFNVKARLESDEIEVYVKTGQVMFADAGKAGVYEVSITLQPGETGVYNKTTRKISKTNEVDENNLFWKTKSLVFSRANLSEVIATIQEYYPVSIVLQNENLKSLHFSATFKDQPVDSILSIITNTFDLKISKEGTHYILDQNEK